MSRWSPASRRVRKRMARLMPQEWQNWLHQLREVDVDREWTGTAILRHSHPSLRRPERSIDAFRRAELRVHSQNGEDGLIAYLVDRVGVSAGEVVEFGIGDGSECCAANLVLTFGWKALLLEASERDAAAARALYEALAPGRVTVVNAFVEPDTIDDLLGGRVSAEFDVLSIDIDGNDYWVFEALEAVRPRIIVVEYNASFGPERSLSIPYTRGFDRYRAHPSGYYHGASLTALACLGERKGYVLAGCDSRGVNAFLVDAQLAEGRIESMQPAEAFAPLYERAHHSLEEQFAMIAHLPLVEV